VSLVEGVMIQQGEGEGVVDGETSAR
jgi:hypothetical protein